VESTAETLALVVAVADALVLVVADALVLVVADALVLLVADALVLVVADALVLVVADALVLVVGVEVGVGSTGFGGKTCCHVPAVELIRMSAASYLDESMPPPFCVVIMRIW